MATTQPEVWLRGPVPGVPPVLQPVAHALLQAREEVEGLMRDFPDARLSDRPAGLASVGFHLRHLRGVIDRLCTYAQGMALSEAQLDALRAEADEDPSVASATLVAAFAVQVDQALDLLGSMDEGQFLVPRAVGRARLPSTTLGLLVHAAEHTMRHVGQLLATVRVVTQAA